MPYVNGSLMQAIHDYHFGERGKPAEKVGILVIDEQPYSVGMLAEWLASLEVDNNSYRHATLAEWRWARPIVIQARREAGNTSELTSSELAWMILAVKRAYSVAPGDKPTRAEFESGLRMLAQEKVLEFCEKVVRRRDRVQMSEVRVLALAGRLQIPVWLIELNSTLGLSKIVLGGPSPTVRTHVGLRVRVNAPVIVKARYNAFDQTSLHRDLQAANIKRVALMGRQTNCCVMQTAIGGNYRLAPFVPGATGNGYKVMTSQDVIGEGQPRWVDSPGCEFYTRL
jgi:Isochorismatase family